MSTGNIGVGTTIKFDDNLTTPAYVESLGQVRSFSGLTEEAAEVDITNFGSTGNAREFIAGLIDPGTAEMEVVFNDTDLERVYNDWDQTLAGSQGGLFRKTMAWQITLPSTNTLTFQGFISAVNWEIPVDDAVLVSLTLRVTGDVTYA